MTLKKNILANYLGAGVVTLAPILALPWYLAALGPAQFGLIGFMVTLQAVLGLVDAGMSQALVREMAVRFEDDAGNGRRGAGALLFGFERLYWLFAVGAGGVVALLADGIAGHWLHLGGLPVDVGSEAVYGAAAIFAAQFPGSVYRSLLVGAQAQVELNAIMLGGALLRHVGGVIAVLHWPTLTTYLLWHTATVLLETLVRGHWSWRTLGMKRSQVGWDATELRPIWRLVAAMSGATWLGALTVQMDKIVLSRMASIEQFGYYTIAATVASGVLQLIYPLVQAALPRAIQLRARAEDLYALNVKLLKLIALVTGLGVLIFVGAGNRLLEAWLQNPAAARAVYPLLAILLVGTALNAFYNVGYINWIVHEKIHRVFQVNAAALVLAVVLVPVMVTWMGASGAAIGWLAINLIGLVLSLEWVMRKQNERKI